MGNGSLCKLEIIDDVHIEAPIIDGMYRVAGKFGGLAVYITTAKFKSANILAIAFWAQPPNLIPANISGYTVYGFGFCRN